jgi:glycosyltransferase involved in cell wall biosynthesis
MREVSTHQDVSIIIEWENALNVGAHRTQAMLRELARQLNDEPGGNLKVTEIISVFDPTNIAEPDVRAAIDATLSGNDKNLTIKFLPAPGANYYAQKNIGVSSAAGTIVLFLDSDVVPENGWLREVLKPFGDPAITIVGSAVYLEHRTLVQKTLALIWTFEPRVAAGGLREAQGYFANSVAFRRDTFMSDPFEVQNDRARGACSRQAQRFLDRGVIIYRSADARLEHPAPEGVVGFIERAIATGRDSAVGGRRGWPRSLMRAIVRGRRLLLYRRRVGLPVWQIPGAAVVAACWWTCIALGGIATMVAPSYMKRRFLL